MSRHVIVIRFYDDHLPMRIIDAGNDKTRAEMLRRSVYMDARKENLMPGRHVLSSVQEVEDSPT